MERLFRITDYGLFKETINLLLQDIYFSEEDVVTMKNESIEAKKEFQELLTCNEFNIDKMREILKNKPWAEENRVNYCIYVLTENINELILQSVQNYNRETGDVLLDFDWTVKLVLGTSHLKSLNYNIIQLILNTVNLNKLSNTTHEMKKDVLLKLITLLESVSND